MYGRGPNGEVLITHDGKGQGYLSPSLMMKNVDEIVAKNNTQYNNRMYNSPN